MILYRCCSMNFDDLDTSISNSSNKIENIKMNLIL